MRAVATARRDFETLTEAAALFSTHIWEVPQQIRKSQDESKAAQKTQHRLLEEVAELQAAQMLQSAEQRGAQKLVAQYFAERDLGFHQNAGAEADERPANVWRCWLAEARSRRWSSRRRPGCGTTWAR